MNLFTELKRRNVYRVGAIYVVVSWLILQVVDVVGSILELPVWAGKLIFLLLAIGLPVALILAWAFELTPDGIRREIDHTSDLPSSERKVLLPNFVIGGALIVALSYIAWDHDWDDGKDQAETGFGSIVVLPFQSMMDDPDQEYFVAGMHESLITELSRIDALRVISRTSSMRFRNSGKTVPEIAAELNVETVVEGSVLKAGDTVRITVQLIDGARDEHIWTESFDRELSDILALYSEVTREITRQVEVTLTADEQAGLAVTRTVDPAVYELFLKGRYLCENWSPSEMALGAQLLQEAVVNDPANAPAHAELALCLQYSAFFGYEKAQEIFARSRSAALTAIQLDEQLAEGHVALAGILYYLEYKPVEAKEALERALELDPSSIKALMHLAWLLGEAGRFEEAMAHNRKALELDPLSTTVNHAVGQLFFLNRDYERSLAVFEKTLELDRSDPSLHYSVAWPLEQMGRYSEAIAAHKRAIELSNGASLYRAALGHSYGLAGMHDEARRILKNLVQDDAAAAVDVAIVHLGLGEFEAAMDWLEKAFEARDSQVIYINRAPKYDVLREHPRFIDLLNRIEWLPR